MPRGTGLSDDDDERQSHKMEAVGRLAGGVAHDFNNLLNVIAGYAELLQRDLEPGHKGHARLQHMRRATERAIVLTRRLLTFSRKQVTEPGVVDLNVVVQDMEAMLSGLVGEDLRLVFVPGSDLWTVFADPAQIEQVVMNLVVNARDALPRGGRVVIETSNVTLPATPGSAEVPHVLLTVADNGDGMTPETIAQIFEPFFTTKDKDRGTGLGLSMVHAIVTQAGGQIHVESRRGEGTTFFIHLPRSLATGPAGGVEAIPLPLPGGGTETVLVVEDEAALREMVCEILTEAGYSVLEADGPDSAFRLGVSHPAPIHLILADFVLPGGSGQELVEQLREERPTSRVLLMSGYSAEALSPRGIMPGTPVLSKPFTTEALLRAVRRALDEA